MSEGNPVQVTCLSDVVIYTRDMHFGASFVYVCLYFLCIFGVFLVYFWCIFGVFLVYFLCIFGVFLVYF